MLFTCQCPLLYFGSEDNPFLHLIFLSLLTSDHAVYFFGHFFY